MLLVTLLMAPEIPRESAPEHAGDGEGDDGVLRHLTCPRRGASWAAEGGSGITRAGDA
jgi:hypothetical protein